MRASPTWEEDEDLSQAPARRSFGPQVGAALVTLASAAGATFLVTTTDPTPQGQRVFVALVLIAAAGLGSIFARALGAHTGSPLADSLRAWRRGVLFGLACAGAVVLQLNAALVPTNLAFLLLVLLIVEMIFLARRQHPV